MVQNYRFFLLCQKLLAYYKKSLAYKDCVPLRYLYISYRKYIKMYFWLVIYIAKDFIWTTLNVIFSIFRFFLYPLITDLGRILSYPNKPFINGKLIYSAFRWCINLNLSFCTLVTWFVVQGYICYFIILSYFILLIHMHFINVYKHTHYN